MRFANARRASYWLFVGGAVALGLGMFHVAHPFFPGHFDDAEYWIDAGRGAWAFRNLPFTAALKEVLGADSARPTTFRFFTSPLALARLPVETGTALFDIGVFVFLALALIRLFRTRLAPLAAAAAASAVLLQPPLLGLGTRFLAEPLFLMFLVVGIYGLRCGSWVDAICLGVAVTLRPWEGALFLGLWWGTCMLLEPEARSPRYALRLAPAILLGGVWICVHFSRIWSWAQQLRSGGAVNAAPLQPVYDALFGPLLVLVLPVFGVLALRRGRIRGFLLALGWMLIPAILCVGVQDPGTAQFPRYYLAFLLGFQVLLIEAAGNSGAWMALLVSVTAWILSPARTSAQFQSDRSPPERVQLCRALAADLAQRNFGSRRVWARLAEERNWDLTCMVAALERGVDLRILSSDDPKPADLLLREVVSEVNGRMRIEALPLR